MKTILIKIAAFILLSIATLFVAIWGACKGAVKEVKELWGMW